MKDSSSPRQPPPPSASAAARPSRGSFSGWGWGWGNTPAHLEFPFPPNLHGPGSPSYCLASTPTGHLTSGPVGQGDLGAVLASVHGEPFSHLWGSGRGLTIFSCLPTSAPVLGGYCKVEELTRPLPGTLVCFRPRVRKGDVLMAMAGVKDEWKQGEGSLSSALSSVCLSAGTLCFLILVLSVPPPHACVTLCVSIPGG